MPSIAPEVMVHRLNVDPDHKPVNQKRRAFGPERYATIIEEVEKLLEAGSSPLLSKLVKGEPLFLYLAVLASAVSLALIRESEGKQHLIYYVSKALVPAETRYSSMERLALALAMSAR
ncbi:uncharacterized protein LOC131226951 [Magnolia sinica]|uniref:uncharacterized protein LOC131226951 n=1 Tax=Magnolia sinica TaxID=86752 RepID=UPI00265B1642|nr:uncharacterized protein LOC131226951 [Magnolia sinica]